MKLSELSTTDKSNDDGVPQTIFRKTVVLAKTLAQSIFHHTFESKCRTPPRCAAERHYLVVVRFIGPKDSVRSAHYRQFCRFWLRPSRCHHPSYIRSLLLLAFEQRAVLRHEGGQSHL